MQKANTAIYIPSPLILARTARLTQATRRISGETKGHTANSCVSRGLHPKDVTSAHFTTYSTHATDTLKSELEAQSFEHSAKASSRGKKLTKCLCFRKAGCVGDLNSLEGHSIPGQQFGFCFLMVGGGGGVWHFTCIN